MTTLITPGEKHGNNKDPDMTWSVFFENILGEQVPDMPVTFDQANMALAQLLHLVSAQVCALQKEQTALGRKHARLDRKVHRAERKEEKKLASSKRKAEELIQMKEDGTEQEQVERKRRRQGTCKHCIILLRRAFSQSSTMVFVPPLTHTTLTKHLAGREEDSCIIPRGSLRPRTGTASGKRL